MILDPLQHSTHYSQSTKFKSLKSRTRTDERTTQIYRNGIRAWITQFSPASVRCARRAMIHRWKYKFSASFSTSFPIYSFVSQKTRICLLLRSGLHTKFSVNLKFFVENRLINAATNGFSFLSSLPFFSVEFECFFFISIVLSFSIFLFVCGDLNQNKNKI